MPLGVRVALSGVALILAALSVSLGAQGQEASSPSAAPPATTRLRFAPPAEGVLAYKVTQRETKRLGSHTREVSWSHIIELSFTGRRSPDLLDATATLRHVELLSGDKDDAQYLIAKTLEARPFRVALQDGVGMPLEVDWTKLKAIITAGLPRIAEPEVARAITASLPAYDALEGAPAVLGPFLITSVGFFAPYRIDGTVLHAPRYEGPGASLIGGRSLSTIGGPGRRDPSILEIRWIIDVDPKAAAQGMLSSLGANARLVARSDDATWVKSTVAEHIGESVSYVERGKGEYEPTRGTMRRWRHDVRVKGANFSQEADMDMERVSP
ncbi:MAG TPA: hypothetical protein VIL65_13780 [Beijerinckiaceae bacterium]